MKIILCISLLFSPLSFSCVYTGCGCTGCYRVLDLSDVMGYQPIEKKSPNKLLENNEE